MQRAATSKQRIMGMLVGCEEILREKNEVVVSSGFSV